MPDEIEADSDTSTLSKSVQHSAGRQAAAMSVLREKGIAPQVGASVTEPYGPRNLQAAVNEAMLALSAALQRKARAIRHRSLHFSARIWPLSGPGLALIRGASGL